MAMMTSLDDLDRALAIAKKHGVTVLKIGDVEAVLASAPESGEKTVPFVDGEQRIDIDAIAHNTYKHL